MIKKLKDWWYLNKPIITTNKERYENAKKASNFRRNCTWRRLQPVINDLEKLRANTWDQDKITFMQEYLRNEFEVKDEN